MQPMFPEGVRKLTIAAFARPGRDAAAARTAASRTASASAFIAIHSVMRSGPPPGPACTLTRPPAPVAQWTERRTSNPRVGGSNPPRRIARPWRGTVRTMSETTLQTNHGPIKIELFPDDAPKTVGNFQDLAQ